MQILIGQFSTFFLIRKVYGKIDIKLRKKGIMYRKSIIDKIEFVFFCIQKSTTA